MCYSVSVRVSNETWASIQEIYRTMTGNEFQKMLDEGIPHGYFVDVYKDMHPELPVISSDKPSEIQWMRWGVIPSYADYLEVFDKNQNLITVHPYDFRNKYSKTANAQVEKLKSAPTWRRLYKNRRCVLPVTGFFEFYHLEGKKVTYPHYIKLKDHEAYGLACIWDEWTDTVTGEIVKSFAVITTEPNDMMRVIHNNPKAHSGPRMPSILPVSEWQTWLDGEFTYDNILQMCKPFPTNGMVSIPVRQGLKKKDANTDTPKVLEKINYAELGNDWRKYGHPQEPNQQSLF